ncbi:MAG: thioredoxin, partial [Xanthobacteraceae bacterium]
MNFQSMVTAAALTAVWLLSLPLSGYSANESKIDTRVILADAGRAAPDFVGIDTWLNSSPLKIADLRGKVVLIDFWTYGCYNCVNTLPYVT